MERSVAEVFAYVTLAVLGLALLAVIGFAFTFGAADHREVTFEAEPLSPDELVDDLTYDPSERWDPLVDHTVQNGSGRTVSLRYEPIFAAAPAHRVHGERRAESVYVERAGTFYRLAVSNVSEVQTRRQTLELVRVNETADKVVRFDDLPAVDRTAVNEAHALKYRRACDDVPRSGGISPCLSVYSRHGADQSVLVRSPPADYVRYRNQTFQLVVGERTVAGTAITYRATPVTDDPVAFRSRFVTEVGDTDLATDERRLLEQAIDGGYHIEVYRHDLETFPRDRFNRLLPKLGLPTIDELSRGHHGASVGYIEYRGEYFRLHVEYSDTYT